MYWGQRTTSLWPRPTSPTCPTSPSWGSGTSTSTIQVKVLILIHIPCRHCFLLLKSYCLPISSRVGGWSWPVKVDPVEEGYPTRDEVNSIDSKCSKHKKPFISAPERPRTVLNAFLNCLYFYTSIRSWSTTQKKIILCVCFVFVILKRCLISDWLAWT